MKPEYLGLFQDLSKIVLPDKKAGSEVHSGVHKGSCCPIALGIDTSPSHSALECDTLHP